MSTRNTGPSPRRTRRQNTPQSRRIDPARLDLPGPLRFLTNPKVFVMMGVIFAAGMFLGLLSGVFGITTTTNSDSHSPVQQANELADVPRDEAGATAVPVDTPVTAVVKRYTQAPALVIDPAKRYLATITTAKGEIRLELYADQAPEAVNAFVFLARDGYYTGTPFMQVTKNADGSRFTAQAGDPTRTGLGTPGFTTKKELTSLPFTRGAVGYDSGQFYISYGDYPALTGKNAIIGRVVSGLDVVERLLLLDPKQAGSGSGDVIQAFVITEN